MPDFTKLTINAVLRIPDVRLSREALEAACGAEVFRFERSRKSEHLYAQINALETVGWDGVLQLIRRVGPGVERLWKHGEIGRPSLDIAFLVPAGATAVSMIIPSEVALAISRHDIDIEVSVYPTASEEAEDS